LCHERFVAIIAGMEFRGRQLPDRPITVSEARSLGLTWEQLQGRQWARVGYGYYCDADLGDDPITALTTVAMRMGRRAVFSGRTAAWLHGLDLLPCVWAITKSEQF